ncbi:uncharacterized protein LOC124264349 [Haliotis rubra]|uniref:uncharacterized protein LOC124264349 n=1 Tax=Haliotis rubra TaxID=36100 RepID=UPI001EE5C9CF|nr:uncharacterized protein LOC124264349 [Haliotis rubra]
MACATPSRETKLVTEPYAEQNKRWPKSGRHILAHYDEKTVVVYQAFNPSIASYAVEHQEFGGDSFSYTRMSWIKTNFLWMMYRCGWAAKKDQQRVLAVTLTRDGFEEILANAYTVNFQKSRNVRTEDIEVRLQWDPDHTPSGEKVERRAIQLGLKGNMLKKYGKQFIVKIEDITPFVKEQRQILMDKGQWEIHTPCERVYNVTNDAVAQRIALDFHETGPTLVS